MAWVRGGTRYQRATQTPVLQGFCVLTLVIGTQNYICDKLSKINCTLNEYKLNCINLNKIGSLSISWFL